METLLNFDKERKTKRIIEKHGPIENKVDEFLLLETDGKKFFDIIQEADNPKDLSLIIAKRTHEFTNSTVNPSMVRKGIESYSLESLKNDEKTLRIFVSSLLKMYLSK